MSLFHLEFFASHFLGPSHLFKVPLFFVDLFASDFLVPIIFFRCQFFNWSSLLSFFGPESFSQDASLFLGLFCLRFFFQTFFFKVPVFHLGFFVSRFLGPCHFSKMPLFLTFLLPFFGFSHFFSGAAFSLGVFFFLIVWVPVIFLRWHFSFLTFSLPTSAKKNICSAHLGTCHRKNVQKAQLFPFGGLSPEKFQFQIAKQKVG